MSQPGALRNTAHATIAAWTEFFLGMLVSIAIARSLTPESYGHFSFMMWCATVFVIFGNGGLTTAVIKFMAEAGSATRAGLYRHLARLQLLFLCVATLLALMAGTLRPEFFSATASTELWLALLAASVLKASYIFRMSASKGREHFAVISRVILVVAPCNLGANLAVAWLSPSLGHFVAVYLMTCALYLLVTAVLDKPEAVSEPLPPGTRQRVWHHLWITSLSIILSFLVLRQSEVFFLRLYANTEAIGFFNIAFTLGFALSALIPGVYSALLLPMMSRQSGATLAARQDTLQASLRYLQLLAIPMMLATQVLATPLVTLLYGVEYQAAIGVLQWVIAGVGIAAIGQAGVSQLVSADQQGRVLRINLLVTVLVLALDWFAIRHLQLQGAAMAFTAGNVLHALLMLFWAVRLCQTRWQWHMSVRIVLAALVPALVAALVLQTLGGAGGALLSLLLGAFVYTLLYAPATVVAGCWQTAELLRLATLSERLPGQLGRSVSGLLQRVAR